MSAATLLQTMRWRCCCASRDRRNPAVFRVVVVGYAITEDAARDLAEVASGGDYCTADERAERFIPGDGAVWWWETLERIPASVDEQKAA